MIMKADQTGNSSAASGNDNVLQDAKESEDLVPKGQWFSLQFHSLRSN